MTRNRPLTSPWKLCALLDMVFNLKESKCILGLHTKSCRYDSNATSLKNEQMWQAWPIYNKHDTNNHSYSHFKAVSSSEWVGLTIFEHFLMMLWIQQKRWQPVTVDLNLGAMHLIRWIKSKPAWVTPKNNFIIHKATIWINITRCIKWTEQLCLRFITTRTSAFNVSMC